MFSILDAVTFILTIAALVGAFFLSQALTGSAPARISSGHVSESFAQRAYVWCAIVGLGGLAWAGTYALLRWMPGSWNELRWTASAFAGLASIPLILVSDTLPRLRRDRANLLTTAIAEHRRLEQGASPTDSDILVLETALQALPHTPTERQVAISELEFMRLLKRRDEGLIQRYQRQLEVQAEEARKAAEAERLAGIEAAAQAKDRARSAFLEQEIPRRLRATAPAHSVPQVGDSNEVVVPADKVRSAWKTFTSEVVHARPDRVEATRAAEVQVRAGLEELEGVHVSQELQVVVDYQGSERDGFADAMGRYDSRTVPLARAVKFDETISGLLNALFLSDWLRRRWSWGHGLYDRDFEPILDSGYIIRLLHDVELPERGNWPMPGVRIQRREAALTVSCLASRPGLGIFDCSTTLSSGVVVAQHCEKVFVWGRGVLY